MTSGNYFSTKTPFKCSVRIPFILNPFRCPRLSTKIFFSRVINLLLTSLARNCTGEYREFVIYLLIYLLHPWVWYELTSDQLPVGWIVQLVRTLHWYRRGHGPVRFPFKAKFFSGLLFSTAKVECITAMIFHLLKMYIRSTIISISYIHFISSPSTGI